MEPSRGAGHLTAFVGRSGNLLESEADALVNTVNTVGVMGKGIALQFKNAFPAKFKAHKRACKRNEVALGKMFTFDNGQLMRPNWIVTFPTTGPWRSQSRMPDITAGFDDFRAVVAKLDIHSIALPPLGCTGGLDWGEVRPLIERRLDGLDLTVHLYVPAEATKECGKGARLPRRSLRRAMCLGTNQGSYHPAV